MAHSLAGTSGWISRRLPDLFIALLLFFGAFALTFRAADWKKEQYIWAAGDIWFDADIARIVRIESEHTKGYDRTTMHPLFPYLTVPPVRLLSKAMSPGTAVRIFHSAVGALWITAFFLLMRRFGLHRPDAALFTTVLASSATAIFWLTIPESFVLGGLTMYPALALAAAGTAGLWPHAGAVFLSLGVTITNGMAGGLAAVATLPWKRAFGSIALGVAGIGALTLAHKVFFSGSAVMLNNPGGEAAWMFAPESGGPFAILRAFFFSAMVAPEIRFVINWQEPLLPIMTFQFGELFSGNIWSWPATLAWAGLLGLGLHAAATQAPLRRVGSVVLSLSLGQLLLHLVYGRETFLYAPHFVPVLVALAALSALGRFRKASLSLAAVLVVCNVLNNVPLFDWAKNYTHRNGRINELQKKGMAKDFTAPVAGDPARHYRFFTDVFPR